MSTTGITKCGNTEFRWGERTYIMGIINMSPDSFSGDGISEVEAAVAQAQRMVEAGADILDIGGESTRPGASPIEANEEIRRVVPVVERLAGKVTVPISIDTYKSDVARRALDAGANMLNDQWGLKFDPSLAELAAERGVPIILMNNLRDKPNRDAAHKDVIAETIANLRNSLKLASRMGVHRENTIIDPGIGFLRTWQENLEVLRRLEKLKVLGRPILIGTSRKSFIGRVLNLPEEERLEGTATAIAIGIARGADIVRVHDVQQMLRVCRMADAIVRKPAI